MVADRFRKGFPCPCCQSQADPKHGILFVYRTKRPRPDRVVRYRQCKCGYRIVTEERQTKVAPPKKKPTEKKRYRTVPQICA